MTIPPTEILAKTRVKNTGEGKGKHVDAVVTEQLQPSESYFSQSSSATEEISCNSNVEPSFWKFVCHQSSSVVL